MLTLCLAGGLVGSLVVTRPPTPFDGGPIFQASTEIYGRTFGQWSVRHWQWTLSFPIGHNPGQDPTGITCGTDQDGPVFFLPRNFPPCTIPSDKIIFVPIAGTECSTAEPPPYHGEDEGDLRACAIADVDRYKVVIVRVDGVLVPNIGSLRVATPLFRLNLPANNVLGVSPTVADSVADGYQMMLAPLPPGEHEILVHLELADGTVLPDKVAQLTIVESGH